METLEIEIKAYCDDHALVADELIGMGAQYVGKVTERDMYLNHPARDFKKTDEALRIRQSDGMAILTYKGPRIGSISKTRIEQEVHVSDYSSLLAVLEYLGFSKAGAVVKVRQKYNLNDIEISLDTVEDLGTFVELEKMGVDHEAVEKELFRLAGELGLNRFERRSYLELKGAAI